VRRRPRGLSLIETIFATFILGLVGMALISVLPTSVMAEKRSQNRIMGENVAMSLLERYRVESFDALADGDVDLPDRPPVNGVAFKVHRTVTLSTSGRLKRVRLAVSWDEAGWGRGQSTRQVVVEGLIYRVNR